MAMEIVIQFCAERPADMRFSPRPYIDGDLVIARAEDDDAMSMVKRYRLARSAGQ